MKPAIERDLSPLTDEGVREAFRALHGRRVRGSSHRALVDRRCPHPSPILKTTPCRFVQRTHQSAGTCLTSRAVALPRGSLTRADRAAHLRVFPRRGCASRYRFNARAGSPNASPSKGDVTKREYSWSGPIPWSTTSAPEGCGGRRRTRHRSPSMQSSPRMRMISSIRYLPSEGLGRTFRRSPRAVGPRIWSRGSSTVGSLRSGSRSRAS